MALYDTGSFSYFATGSMLFLTHLVLFFVAALSSDNYNDTSTLLNFRSSADSKSELLYSWVSSDCCSSSWDGVTCHEGRVSRLSLRGKGLSGSIQALMALTELRVLVLADNFLDGELPTSLNNWKALWLLSLSNNSFTGSIPASISSLRRLWRLDLSHNAFSGPVPSSSLNTFPRLLTLHLQHNAFSGPFPLLSISSLIDLSLQNNRLSGTIPVTVNLANLSSFDASYNNLTGPIPAALSRFPRSSFAGNVNLCGGPLPPCNSSQVFSVAASPMIVPSNPSSQPSISPSKKSTLGRLSLGVIVGIVIGDVIVLLLLTLLFLLYYWKKVHEREDDDDRWERKGSEAEKGGIVHYATTMQTEKNKLVFVSGEKRFGLDDLLRASAEMLGKGSLGSAYKAVLEDGFAVSVKRLKEVSSSGKREFEQHMQSIGSLSHPHIVPLRAYYYAKEEKLLVYEFMPCGSLYNLLHGNREPGGVPLDWATRARVVLGAARGLAHVHEHAQAHGNLKSTNVLLDGDGNACISDFGLLLLLNPAVVATRLLGYRAPESISSTWTSADGAAGADVYSFGVLLLEVLTGKVPGQCVQEEGVDLPAWVQSVVREEWTAEVFDLELMRFNNDNVIEEQMVRLLQIAMACAAPFPSQRPRMSQVVKMIEDIRGSADVSPSAAASASASASSHSASEEAAAAPSSSH